jgi:hypothetical protein
VRSLSRLAILNASVCLAISAISTPVEAVEIPKPVINIPRPNIPRPVINVPKPNVTVNVPRPTINVPRPAVNVPKVSAPRPVVNVPKRSTEPSPRPQPALGVSVPKDGVPERTVHTPSPLTPKSVARPVPAGSTSSAIADPKTSRPATAPVAELPKQNGLLITKHTTSETGASKILSPGVSMSGAATSVVSTQPLVTSPSLRTPPSKMMSTASVPSQKSASSSSPPAGTVTFNGSTPNCNPAPCQAGQVYTAGNGSYAGVDVVISGTGAVTPTSVTTTSNGITSTITAAGSAQQTTTITVGSQTYTVNGGGPTTLSGNVMGQPVSEVRSNGTSTVNVGGAAVAVCGYSTCNVMAPGQTVQSIPAPGANGEFAIGHGKFDYDGSISVARIPSLTLPQLGSGYVTPPTPPSIVPYIPPISSPVPFPGSEDPGKVDPWWSPDKYSSAAKKVDEVGQTIVDTGKVMLDEAYNTYGAIYQGINNLQYDPTGSNGFPPPENIPPPPTAPDTDQDYKELGNDLKKVLPEAVEKLTEPVADKIEEALGKPAANEFKSDIGKITEVGTEKAIDALASKAGQTPQSLSIDQGPTNAPLYPGLSTSTNVAPYYLQANPAPPSINANPPPVPLAQPVIQDRAAVPTAPAPVPLTKP